MDGSKSVLRSVGVWGAVGVIVMALVGAWFSLHGASAAEAAAQARQAEQVAGYVGIAVAGVVSLIGRLRATQRVSLRGGGRKAPRVNGTAVSGGGVGEGDGREGGFRGRAGWAGVRLVGVVAAAGVLALAVGALLSGGCTQQTLPMDQGVGQAARQGAPVSIVFSVSSQVPGPTSGGVAFEGDPGRFEAGGGGATTQPATTQAATARAGLAGVEEWESGPGGDKVKASRGGNFAPITINISVTGQGTSSQAASPAGTYTPKTKQDTRPTLTGNVPITQAGNAMTSGNTSGAGDSGSGGGQ